MSERGMRAWAVIVPAGMYGGWELVRHAYLMNLPMAQYHLLSMGVESILAVGIVVLGISAMAARQRHQGEVEKKRFCCEVLRAVTHGKLSLADANEIPEDGRRVLDVPLKDAAEYHQALRRKLKEIAVNAGMAPEHAGDLALAVGEAATNAVKHAAAGRCAAYVADGRVIARVSDRGNGIRTEDLPATVLESGFSTKVSLGMGYTLMLQLCDRIWLATGPEGTVVQLEKWLRPEERTAAPLPIAWERL